MTMRRKSQCIVFIKPIMNPNSKQYIMITINFIIKVQVKCALPTSSLNFLKFSQSKAVKFLISFLKYSLTSYCFHPIDLLPNINF